ncbi:ZIP family metal transporter [Candidatus Micrarchaeota archaeon]|nr:ZIP family metal transporter [Candidatus Micrarchaeota archaeon]MBU1930080.1 ZIP family metal transporter [Candidatus Micrarchaeota archaeon]
MHVFWLSILSVFLVSLLSLIGIAFLALGEKKIRKILLYLVSFSAGSLLGGAFFHLLPEAFESSLESIWISTSVLLGILLFFVLEKVIHWHHCHNMKECEHTKALGITNLVGDGLHNFIDGIIIAASFLVAIPLGIATTLAVALHEIPQEISDFGVLLHAGFSKKKALFFNFLSALGAIVGAIFVFLLHDVIGGLELFLIPLTAGGFIYIASADLIPELHKEIIPHKTALQFVFLVLGMIIMAAMLFLE